MFLEQRISNSNSSFHGVPRKFRRYPSRVLESLQTNVAMWITIPHICQVFLLMSLSIAREEGAQTNDTADESTDIEKKIPQQHGEKLGRFVVHCFVFTGMYSTGPTH